MGRRLAWLLPLLVIAVVATGIGVGLGTRDLVASRGSVAEPARTTPPTTSPVPPPGPDTVELSPDAAAHPHGARVRDLLQRHFGAINSGDYDVWVSTVVARRSAEMPREEWRAAYESTKDGSLFVRRIEPSPGGLVVLLSFTSVQAPDKAPALMPGATCVNWNVSYRVVEERGFPRIDFGVPNTTVVNPCRA